MIGNAVKYPKGVDSTGTQEKNLYKLPRKTVNIILFCNIFPIKPAD